MDDRLYRTFAAIEDRHWWFVARRRILKRLIARWVPSGARVIDVGCGTGGLLADLRHDYEVRGVDPAPLALEACRRRGLSSVAQGSAGESSGWGALPVDAILLLDVIEHLDGDVAALDAARNALTPDGHVIVTVPAYQWLWTDHDELNQHRRRYTVRRLRAAHAQAGLRPVQIGYFNSLLFPLALIERGLARLGIKGDPLRLPSRPLNRALEAVFSWEGRALAHSRGGFPFGLSILCVSVRDSADR